ncbi:MAG TPA: NAD(P)/FAD-dependent oxidoreductase [Flavobacterium sp.]|uniref:NAD(P)/FAD-dependent oxidoreductase n=1 Tax=Flavobacterium sp. TaxID=239 RepID=UPI002C4380C4|nr:NAD(P)/FAD-dependent oxidoreductase [Flavobacterium sp.]HNP33687.1 NAD(P)/FAD-dependent oxidoreductase [Flavobacterium sp.]
MKKALIIGGGPAGLTAAYELLNHTDIKPIVVEMSSNWGGISRTENHNGNRIDIGGHRFFSKSDEVMNWWQQILPIQTIEDKVKISYQNKEAAIKIENKNISNPDDVFLIRKRVSRIFYKGTFFDYPIKLNLTTLTKLGFFETVKIVLSYSRSILFPIKNVKTLEDFFINRFGKHLYKTFFKDYTEKVWGVPCNEISAEWGAQRIKSLSVYKTLLNYILKPFRKKDLSQKKTETSLIEYFLYPKYGPGHLWTRVAEKIEEKGGDLIVDHKVISLSGSGNLKQCIIENIHTKEIQQIDFDYCISTMPVKELIQAFTFEVPSEVKNVSENLIYRDFITVGLLLDETCFYLEDNWIYIQESYVKVGRIQVFNNWSPYLVKDNSKTWLGLEYFCNENDELWNLSNDEMVSLAAEELVKLGFIKNSKAVEDSTVIKVPKTYPAYFGAYSSFETIKEFTDTIPNLFLIGRNGMHKYNNQDHSMLTAIQAVQNIKNGVTSKDNIWSINTEEDYHEEK